MVDSIKKYWFFASLKKSHALGYLLCAVLSGLLEAAGLVTLIPALNSIAAGEINTLYLLLFPLGVLLLGTLFKFLAESLQSKLISGLEFKLRRQLIRQIFLSPWKKVRQLTQGNLTNGVISEASQVSNGVMAFLNSISTFVVVLIFWASAFAINAAVAALISVFLVAMAIFVRLRLRRFRAVESLIRQDYENVSEKASSLLAEIKFMRLAPDKDFWITQIDNQTQKLSQSRGQQLLLPATNKAILEGSASLFLVASFGILALNGVPLATAIVFLGIFYRLVPRIQALQGYLSVSSGQKIWLEHWSDRHDKLGKLSERSFGGEKTPIRIEHPVSGLGISAADVIWQMSDKNLDQGLELKLSPGDFVCIVGKTGEGKTTLIDTLLGLAPRSRGSIRMSNIEIPILGVTPELEMVSIVTQDVPIFEGTILTNIISSFELDEKWLSHVVRITDLESFVSRQTQGLATDISNKGLGMSGGERQRIGIARAIYSKPRLLVLDESTNGLDEETERKIMEAIRALDWKPTILAISHRTSLMRLSNRVLELRKGILFEGPKDERAE
jgi:ATP-binding cassette subfamily C protein